MKIFMATVCSDYELATIIYILKRFLSLIQIAAPIIAMVALTIIFIRMVINPEDKKQNKALFNTLIATAIVFFIPIIVNLVMQVLAGTGATGITDIPTCWSEAETIHNQIVNNADNYQYVE